MRTIPIAILTIACLALVACNQWATIKNNTPVVQDSISKEPEDSFVAVPGMPGYVYRNAGKVDPVDLDTNFVDTFGVNDQQFRVVYTYADSVLKGNTKLEKLAGDRWLGLFAMDFGWHSGYDRTKDVNGDGYPDFLESWHYGWHPHFYIPSQKTFDTASNFELFDWELLDTVQNIYCQNWNIMGKQAESMLYTFHGVKPVVLYTVDFDKESDGSGYATLKTLYLYKTVPGYKDSSVLISTTPMAKDETEFDYDTYWRKNYKELLGLK